MSLSAARTRLFPFRHDPSVLFSVASERYRALARAVLLQAVKDCTRRVPSGDGVVRYCDHGRRTQTADTARLFLSTPSPKLTFWCLWLNIHPQTIMAATASLTTDVPAFGRGPVTARVH